MKTGYSFGSLVSFTEALNAAAVKITGNQTVGGIKTFSSNPISSAAQGTGGSHLTRKDYVDGALALKAPLASPALIGTPTAPTATAGTDTTQIATTAFVTASNTAQIGTATPLMSGTAAVGVSGLLARQDHRHPTDTTRAPLASPVLTGNPTAPTQTVGNNSTSIATTAFVQTAKEAARTTTYTVAGEADMLALVNAKRGDLVIRSDLNNRTFILYTEPCSTLSNWRVLAENVVISDFAKTLLDDVDAAAMHNTLGIAELEPRISNNESKVFEALRRSYADAGLNLVEGSFEEGGKLSVVSDVMITASGDGYSWGGPEFPHNVAKGTDPTLPGSGYVPRTDDLLREQVIKTYASVTNMLAGHPTNAGVGETVQTLANGSIKKAQYWSVTSALPTKGYWIESNGIYYALVIGSELCLSEIGFDATKTPAQLSSIIAEGCAIARRTPQLSRIRLPAGTYEVNDFIVDIDRRGFEVAGAGKDMTVLINKSVNGVSMLVTRIDPRSRARDKQHDYIKINGFTLDGDITNRGANASARAVIQPNYCNIDIKSVGHILSNLDINGLVIDYSGHTESRKNGATYTLNSLRLRNNAIKCSGNSYTSGEATEPTSMAFVCDDSKTTLAASTIAGATSIVVNTSELELHDKIEIGSEPNIDVRYVVAKSGNNITLDSALSFPHSAGDTVRLGVVSNSYRGTIENGRVYVNNAIGFTLDATYTEAAPILLRGYLPSCTITGISSVEASPAITLDRVDRRSSIKIDRNNTSFSVVVNVYNRLGGQTTDLDLYNMPEMWIGGNTRADGSVNINGVKFSYVEVTRNYNYSNNDRYQTDFKFGGLFINVAPSLTQTALGVFLDTSYAGFDAYTFDITANCRRSSTFGVKAGIMKRAGTASTDGTNLDSATVKTVTAYAYSAEAGNRVDMLISGSTTVGTIRCLGESTGGQNTNFVISGQISHLL